MKIVRVRRTSIIEFVRPKLSCYGDCSNEQLEAIITGMLEAQPDNIFFLAAYEDAPSGVEIMAFIIGAAIAGHPTATLLQLFGDDSDLLDSLFTRFVVWAEERGCKDISLVVKNDVYFPTALWGFVQDSVTYKMRTTQLHEILANHELLRKEGKQHEITRHDEEDGHESGSGEGSAATALRFDDEPVVGHTETGAPEGSGLRPQPEGILGRLSESAIQGSDSVLRADNPGLDSGTE